jgi:Cadherin-like domain
VKVADGVKMTCGVSGPGGTATVNVVNNDSDPDGDLLSVVTSGPPNPTPVPTPDDGIGTVSVVGADTIVFTILPTFTTPGIYTVTIPYTVSDGRGGTASATLTITVTM